MTMIVDGKEYAAKLLKADEARRIYGERGDLHLAETPEAAAEGADALALITEWRVFQSPDFDQIKRLLRARHRLSADQPDDFRSYNRAELAQTSEESARVFTWLLGSIASVSLLVGGIGIMNIMFASVMERIKEIGTRLAIGAQKRDIVVQFLAEAPLPVGARHNLFLEPGSKRLDLLGRRRVDRHAVLFGCRIGIGLVFIRA